MSEWLLFCYKLFNLPLSLLVKSKSIPADPVTELGLDGSRPIMYVLLYKSIIDLLTLRMQCLKHDLADPLEPLIINGIKLPRYVFIHSSKYVFTYYALKKESVRLFHYYLDLHYDNPNLDIQMVPVSIMFGRRPRRKQYKMNSSLLRILNIVQKFFAITWFGRDSFVRFSSSVSLRWMAMEHGTDKAITQKLARVARIHFARQRLAAVGPSIPVRHDLFNKLLTSKAITRAIKDEAHSKKISQKKAQQNAVALIEEIAANFSYEMLRLTDRILGFIWNRLYQRINVHNIERVRQLAYDGHKIVYVPCHRSHMDYLLLSYVLYNQGLVPPHIVAGINLNFWPAGPIFRCLGAFFIRRSFKSNKLYSAVFREYLGELFNCGYSVEYFVEGRRSRTGRLLDPKTGTLSMTIQAILRGKTRPITLVPIYIGYEHVIEVATYAKELRGATKEKESFLQMLRGLSKLCNLGCSYVNFGEPLPLITWLDQHVPEWKKSIDSIDIVRPMWFTPTVNDIATDLMIRINNAGATNAMNLCSTALLSAYQYSLTREQLTEQLDCYLDMMRNVPYSVDSTVPSANSSTLIEHALQMNKFQIFKKDTNSDVIILTREQAVLLTYYRNNIVHMLIIPSLTAAVIIKHNNISRRELLHYINVFYPMLKAELFLRWNHDELAIEINKITNELLRQKLIIIKNNELQVNQLRLNTLKILAAGAFETLQRYAITFWLLSNNPSVNRGVLEKKSMTLAQKLSITYNIDSLEFFDKTVFSTLILTLRYERYITDTGDVEREKIVKVYKMLSKLITPELRLAIEATNM